LRLHTPRDDERGYKDVDPFQNKNPGSCIRKCYRRPGASVKVSFASGAGLAQTMKRDNARLGPHGPPVKIKF
jgi:hypothetical protein